MTYKEMYLVIAEVNRKIIGEEKAKKLALQRIIYFYEHNNGHRPKGIE